MTGRVSNGVIRSLFKEWIVVHAKALAAMDYLDELRCQSAFKIHPLSASNFDPPYAVDQRLACPALAGVAEGRPSAGDAVLRL